MKCLNGRTLYVRPLREVVPDACVQAIITGGNPRYVRPVHYQRW